MASDRTQSRRNRKQVCLKPDDRIRMARLHEEVVGRLEEMTLIMSRNLGGEFHAPAESAVVRFPGIDRDGHVAARMRHFMPCNWGCYDWETGVCRVCQPGDHG